MNQQEINASDYWSEENHERLENNSILVSEKAEKLLEKERLALIEAENFGKFLPKMESCPTELLLEARDKIFEINPLIKRTDEMNNIISQILFYFYVKKYRYIIVEAPTGSGKSVIGYLTFLISKYCYSKLNDFEPTVKNSDGKETLFCGALEDSEDSFPTYYLTSSKVLQEQIDDDIKRFGFDLYMGMLKGSSNYLCTKESQEKNQKIYYNERACLGFTKPALEALPCFNTCPYKVQRALVATKNVAVLNYSFFLNTTKSSFRPLFKVRELTIADECHLVPESVLNTFNNEYSQWLLNGFDKFFNDIIYNFGKDLDPVLLDEINTFKAKCYVFYANPLLHIKTLVIHHENMSVLSKNILKLKTNLLDKYPKPFTNMGFRKQLEKLMVRFDSFNESQSVIQELSERKDDIFIDSTIVNTNNITNTRVYKHIVKDMAENIMSRKHFINNTQRCLMMSATVGNSEHFAHMMGLEEGEYYSMILNSNFDFKESPIFLCRSGKLNFGQYKQNIDKCLYDVIKICETYHPNDRGIIHTSTNVNTRLLREKIMASITTVNRYLFYETSEEKEKCIEKMKSSDSIPYVIIGPSLYEGIDLKNSFGRFNILLKVPYTQYDDYAKQKSLRFKFWYERVAIERTVQAIGRTNRNPKDWSKVYLIDSCFENIIWKCGTEKTILNRIQYLTIR